MPASPPDNVSAVVLSSTSILVSWDVVPPVDQNGIIITYEVLIEPMETFDGNISEQRINSTERSVNITSLQEFVNYSISVRAYTVVGPGNYSDVIVRMTLEDGKSDILKRPVVTTVCVCHCCSSTDCTIECEVSGLDINIHHGVLGGDPSY